MFRPVSTAGSEATLYLESLLQEKGDAAELVLDGRLYGDNVAEVNLAELLHAAAA